MSIDSLEHSEVLPEHSLPLPDVPGGWRLRSVDLEWTTIELMVPVTPDALLDTREVQEANRRDDSMPYWATLWPAAESMSTLLNRATWPKDAEVLEIGCGLGLVGIAALKQGWRVEMTDGDLSSVTAARHNAARNGFPDVSVNLLDWRKPPNRQYPVILACDVLYEVRHHQPVLDLIDTMLADDGICWIGDPGRTPVVPFYHTACERGFHIRIRNNRGDASSFPVRGQFQILEISKIAHRSEIALARKGE